MPLMSAPSAKVTRRSIVCEAGRLGSAFLRIVMTACIFKSGMSASALTPSVAGWPGRAGISVHTTEPRLTAGGFCWSLPTATSIAARADTGRPGVAAGAGAADGVAVGVGAAADTELSGVGLPVGDGAGADD